MSYLLAYDISYKSMQIIKTLGQYRGMTAKQLARMIHAPLEHSLSEEKSVYNFLGKLKKQGLVLSYKLQSNVAAGSLYFLSAKGYELFKEIANVELDHYGDGWIESFEEFGDRSFGDLDYELYKPPLKQPAHHLLMIEFFIAVKSIDGGSVVDHRLNLYAAQTYYIEKEKHRFRPDAEIWIRDNDRRYTIEIDRGTEDFSKLQEKFEVYSRYFDYLKAKGKEEEIPSGIIFVAETKRKTHGIQRRWATILKAFWSKLVAYKNTVNLIFTTIDQVEATLTCEMNRNEARFSQQIETLFKNNKGDIEVSAGYGEDGLSQFTLIHVKDGVEDYFTPLVNEYESLVYSRWYNFYQIYTYAVKENKKLEDAKPIKGCGKVILYLHTKPFLFESFDLFGLDKDATEILNRLTPKNITYVKVKGMY